MKHRKKLACLLLVTLCLTFLFGCKSDSDSTSPTEESDSLVQFDSVEQMQAVVDGTWMNGETGEFVIIKDGMLIRLTEDKKKAKLNAIRSNPVPFDEFYADLLDACGEKIDYDITNGHVKISQTQTLFFRLSSPDGQHAYTEDSIVYIKGATYENDIKKSIRDEYISYKHPYLLTTKDVQYDKHGNLGLKFLISGKAELDDYYNWATVIMNPNIFVSQLPPKAEAILICGMSMPHGTSLMNCSNP